MAKKKAAKKKAAKKKRKAGPRRVVPKKVAQKVRTALKTIRQAKEMLETLAPKARKAWAEIHNAESRLSRLS